MKKLLTQTMLLIVALAITTSTFAQEPTTATRQRRISTDSPQSAAPDQKTATDVPASTDQAGDKTKDKSKTPDVAATDAQTNRTDQASDEAAIVQNYNNFFTTYQLGPEDVISVTVFGQDRYSRGGIKIPPSGRISLALIPDGIFVSGKTVDQVAELIKKRYDEYIIDPQVSVSLDQAGSYRYSVIGDVAQPGIRLMTRRLSVSEAIAEAGGVLQTGDKKKVFVLRKQKTGNLAPIPVNISAIYKGQAPDSVYLLPGDQVVVPGNSLKKWQTLTSFLPILSFARLFTGGF
jgi:protein involved in polysaccharide export with SLBB domain